MLVKVLLAHPLSENAMQKNLVPTMIAPPTKKDVPMAPLVRKILIAKEKVMDIVAIVLVHPPEKLVQVMALLAKMIKNVLIEKKESVKQNVIVTPQVVL